MSPFRLFLTLREHRRLALRRAVDYEKNKAAKWIINIFAALVLVYLVIFAIMLALAANRSHTMSAVEFVCCIVPIITIIDFLCRFSLQQTPSQMIKPYVLLPIPKHSCIDFFIINQLLNRSNFVWFALLLPYCLMSVAFGFGLLTCVNLLLFFWLLELCVSQFYLIVRTLVNDTLLWWLLPAGLFLLFFLVPGTDFTRMNYITSDFTRFFSFIDSLHFYGNIGTSIEEGSPLPCLCAAFLLCLLFATNRRIQYSHVMKEVSRQEKTSLVREGNFLAFLEKRGETGLFLALEIRTITRNKNPRKAFIKAVATVIIFSLVIIFTDIYDVPFTENFWCLYNYTLFGTIALAKIMCAEGNFIDGLMVHKEKIFQILRAKYLFSCTLLLLPFLLMLPVTVSGKWSFLMVLSYGVFTAGFQYFLLFQLAATNRTALPLNTKFVSRSGTSDTKYQLVAGMVCLFAPAIFATMIQLLFSNTAAYIAMLSAGLAFTASHRLWLHNIYLRFMRNRYINTEGFRATR